MTLIMIINYITGNFLEYHALATIVWRIRFHGRISDSEPFRFHSSAKYIWWHVRNSERNYITNFMSIGFYYYDKRSSKNYYSDNLS